MQTPVVDVAAAVIERQDGRFLLAQRPAGKVYAGFWEFPGGKVEPGESSAEALQRELQEELGLHVQRSYPWITRRYSYPHATVRLQFHRVVQWGGEPRPREGQQLSWQHAHAVSVSPVLPANAPILKALKLPLVCAITRAWQIGEAQALAALDLALARGTRLVQIREHALDARQKIRFATEVTRRVHKANGIALLNGGIELAMEINADGVHLTAEALGSATRRPDCEWCGASCHDADQLEQARRLGVDFALLGPVAPTPTHPDAVVLGWEKFSALTRDFALPVFALGGLSATDLHTARMAGAHGIAMLRGAWESGS